MKTRKLTPTKSKAQAMVEFAIALPLLMLLLYGLIEAGRLLFLYSTVVTASRQAVRYGSATGENAAGTPRYGDCDGIRAAAQRVAYLGPFDSITIAHNSGPLPGDPDGDSQIYCSGPTDAWSPADNSQRISVTVSKQFTPIVPGIVPFLQRTIAATSNRTILKGVSIVVEQPTVEYIQYATQTVIDSFSPEPSQPDLNQDVVIQVTVTNTDDPSITPTGEVIITGADVNCTITLNSNGWGTCILHFANSGIYPITADYTGDDEHLPSSVSDLHEVNLAPTVTTIVGVTFEPSVRGEDVLIAVQVTGGSTTPTGTVDVSAGGNRNCVATLLPNGIGSCTINFNQTGNFTIRADYNGDGTHLASTTNPGNNWQHQVLNGTATPSLTPTITPIPTITLTPTITPIPPTGTVTPTAVPICTGLTHGPVVKSGNSLSMTITNPYAYPLTVGSGSVTWNHDKGHQTGSDKTLKLLNATLNGTIIWSSGPTGDNIFSVPFDTPAVIPAAVNGTPTTVSIVFNFHQSYDNFDTSELITLQIITNGCNNLLIDSRY
jgi:hypothetical protein